ncbi:phosphoribosylformimino-5-aminoimidazole carboxamide ribotide isomerase [Conidiobolus coronatus NRRL 28638]|uniref:1-(5-phosphoribosyl)-5-[(5-phosphoribosylamino)methylideneamino] imidazole-4-carboxamide isomerase n=1 Tax=Conidiobolus coronatus (strain ATCC 28846 / CBS 209.66 / NRRL 28638) TaxID=796925 RepID=A0A137PD20_CONC2|nr:phosphoribosylformimino-5-aminoimidazole carboxamide ribotide isomerase [Conidiobolus coronatus NRRL 28638]|eukprot:KXN72896.1 phosphoribosylformimino-5-aminoimidazole carboxamide ribotide isomerase [Conidiobolus coronatus NRRL 28638]
MTVTQFRACIDLHEGRVKQIVGGSLNNKDESLKTNFVSEHPSSYFAKLYKQFHLEGAHIIKLGPRNDEAAEEALKEYPDMLHLGGGINLDNCKEWIEKGASKVIVTSWLFPNAKFSLENLKLLCDKVGKDRLVIDISCRRVQNEWVIAMNKWQTLTDLKVNLDTIKLLEEYCSEFLVHAADLEGLCQGIDSELVSKLGEWVTIPTTYAGGGRSIEDLDLVQQLSNGKVDLTLGSCLDIFGGSLVKFDDAVNWNKQNMTKYASN